MLVSCSVAEQENNLNEDPQAQQVLNEYLSSGNFSSNVELLDSSDPLVSIVALSIEHSQKFEYFWMSLSE